jgi:peptide/nickel transport system ATP-binding protein
MYLGEIVERGATETVLADPAHPYTRVLLSAVPSLDPTDQELGRPLTDTVPNPSDPPSGCRFHPRCPDVIPPDGLSVSGSVWQAIAEFRFSVQAGELPEDAIGSPGAETSTSGDGTDGGRTAAAVRRAVGLGEELADPEAEAAVADAAAALADGDVDAADETLTAAFTSVCEREAPQPVDRPDGGRRERSPTGSVSCLRYDRARSADGSATADR